MTDRLKSKFNGAMRDIYLRAASECRYRPTRFMQMVDDLDGVPAARQLLHSPGHPEGLTKLYELGRLDLSMEALVLKHPWSTLFTEEDLEIARKRLKELRYSPE